MKKFQQLIYNVHYWEKRYSAWQLTDQKQHFGRALDPVEKYLISSGRLTNVNESKH